MLGEGALSVAIWPSTSSPSATLKLVSPVP
jgi:hypothetical protein